MMKEAYML